MLPVTSESRHSSDGLDVRLSRDPGSTSEDGPGEDGLKIEDERWFADS